MTCYVCNKKLPMIKNHYVDDPFCSSDCCRRYYNVVYPK